ncbi:ABC transporter ATP-binding protein [Azospirillum rugosum]|uniref:ATP-binding cassette subfamily B protein n=1 Tax=Azospirillum rugosum TaxID=416170 RepID=A0ABS4SSY0_9PROT|nr:ABC transporter ATP-binding protein [Azospirillum rugosum]MBP2295057.1 ATP-binding cassette subfamily B protein [Azospirillum rugosum]MDQ0528880.1 ATP-binding cassette subfamily B protein [Azospirillum rugosum]
MPKTRLPSAIYWRALKEARPWYPQLAIIIALGLLATPLGLLAPIPVKIIVDSVLGDQPLPSFLSRWLPHALTADKDAVLALCIAFGVALALLTVAHGVAEWLYRETIADQMVRRFRAKVMGNALGQAAARDAGRGVVDQVFRVSQDAPALQAMTIWGVIPLVTKIGSVVWVVWVTALISPQVAAIALASALPLVVLIVLKQRPLCDRWHRVRERESGLTRLAYEVLGARRVVLTAGQEEHEVQRLIDQGRACFQARLSVMLIDAGFRVALALAVGLGTAGVLFVGVRDVQGGALSVGDLLVLLAYMAQLFDPLKGIAEHIIAQQAAFACGERAFALLEAPPAVPERADPRPLRRARGAVSFDRVSFAYPDGPAVLRGASFSVPAGTCVGVVGRTGAGKSTLANLLVRLVDPSAGTIRLDGRDLRDHRLCDLRRQFAILEQEPSLFSTTIAGNIAYGRPDATRMDIEEAARRAHAHGFIAALPDGYDSLVGERALTLSGGERQRIGLARAFLKQAPILILDEPTSALDRETEAAITDAIEELMRGRTTFIIAHRLSTLRRADLILRIDGGQLHVERRGNLAEALGALETTEQARSRPAAEHRVIDATEWARARGRREARRASDPF